MVAVSDVLIVGGGIAGMALAIGLRRRGIRSQIVEINPQWTVLGVGITLQGSALRALKTIGVLDQCGQLGFGYSHFKACDAYGNVTGTVELPRLIAPDYPATVGIMRQAVHSILQEALTAAQVPVQLGVTISSLRRRWLQFEDTRPSFWDGLQAEIHRASGVASYSRPRARGTGAAFLLRSAQQGGNESSIRNADVHVPRAKRSRICPDSGRAVA
jgi:2-polyprenyl-6-methoxyphenol hydroxylase-like FAD-dependent oxidoreductase